MAQLIQFQGSPHVFNKSTGKLLTSAQVESQGGFGSVQKLPSSQLAPVGVIKGSDFAGFNQQISSQGGLSSSQLSSIFGSQTTTPTPVQSKAVSTTRATSTPTPQTGGQFKVDPTTKFVRFDNPPPGFANTKVFQQIGTQLIPVTDPADLARRAGVPVSQVNLAFAAVEEHESPATRFSVQGSNQSSGFFASPTGSVGPKGEPILDVFRSDGTKVQGSEAAGLGLTGEVIQGLPQRPAPTGFVTEFKPVSGALQSGEISRGVDLPEPTANFVQESVINGLRGEVERFRSQLETRIADEKAIVEQRLEGLRAERQQILDEARPSTEPFREELENAERERLKINENFEANQAMVGELEALLTDGNNLIQQMKGVTGLAGIRNPRVNQAIEAVNARAGVIQAVMNARNGQISQAGNLIDRSIAAITADRADNLAYYNTLLELNGKDIINLEKDQKKFLEAQINLIERDLQEAEERADTIRNMMINPNTAQLMGQAGVTLNDSIEEINTKIGNFTYTQEMRELHQGLKDQGLEWIPTPDQLAGIPQDQIVRVTDSRGQVHQYRQVQPTVRQQGGFAQIVNPLTGEILDSRVTPKSTVVDTEKETQKIISQFNTALTNVDELFEVGSREQFIRLLQSRFSQIEPDDIARKVFETYPDDFDF